MNKVLSYANTDDLQADLKKEKINISLSENLDVLKEEIKIGAKTVKNRIAIQPMEGCDGTLSGAPDDLTKRRYDRFAKSGSGLIWFEAVAVVNEGRANKRQLFINSDTLDDFKRMVFDIKETSLKENGIEPLIIMQATHSGRYSKPEGVPAPIIAYNNPVFEKDKPISADRIITDERLRQLEQEMGNAAALAEKAGFDGVDIKCCHRYLNSELLSAYTRKGEYGGSFENRTKFLRNSVANAAAATSSDFIVTSRLNVYDGFPYPYGFGVSEKGGLTPDLSEAVKLVDILHNQLNVKLLDITIGNPYVNPHVNRPADITPYQCEESPFSGVERMINCVGEIQKAFPELCVIGSGLTYFSKFCGNLAAAGIENGLFKIAGFGRQAFAYPEFAKDLLQKGALEPQKCCITCSKCTELMRAGTVAGCVIKDSQTYMPYYKEHCLKKGE